MTENDNQTLIELDARNRASLGKLAGPHRRFLARVEPGGVIILTPAAVVPASFMRQPLERMAAAARALVEADTADPTDNIGTGTTAGPPSAWLDASDDDHHFTSDEWYAPLDFERDDR